MERMDNQEITTFPRIGDPAPEFHAHTTQGRINFPEDYKGSWVILFSHPADFTPVCTSEFMTFAAMEKKFAQANCKLVGLSVDGVFSHIAWLRTIKEKIEYKGMKDVEVSFPVIEDVSMKVAKKYGMIQPGKALPRRFVRFFSSTLRVLSGPLFIIRVTWEGILMRFSG